MGQTFSFDARASNRGKEREIFGDTKVTVRVEPVLTATGGSMGFPVLYVAGWVAEPEKFAARVAELLTDHMSPKAAAEEGESA